MDPRRALGPYGRRLLLGFTLVAAIVSAALMLRPQPEGPPGVLFAVPAFELVDERGQAFGSAALQGQTYVADFVYTGCTDSCPLLTARMGELQDWLRRNGLGARLVSFSVDPDRDTPPKLLDYAQRARYDPARWTFVTGGYAPLHALLNDGFKVAMYREVHDGGATPEELIHDEHFVLVDGRTRVRGYFSTDGPGLASLRRALKYLAAHPGP
jgi:protein SCO1/2